VADEQDRLPMLANKLKWGVGVVAVIAGGAVALAYTASLAAVAIAGTATLAVVHGAPWASQKLANLFLNLRKADARADPVTNRQRISHDTWDRLNSTRKEIESLDAEVKLWRQQIENLPPDEAAEFADELKSATRMVEEQALAWSKAEMAAKEFDRVTESVSRKWKVAQTGMRIKKLSERDKTARINEMLAAEAAEAADKQLATAFSSLDTIIERSRANRALSHNPSPAIDVVPVKVGIEPPQPWPRK